MRWPSNVNRDNIMRQNPRIALLEHPRPANPARSEDVVNSPLSACLMTGYIASALQTHGIDVDIVDANLSEWSIGDTADRLAAGRYRLIGVRLVYLWEKTDEVFAFLARLKGSASHPHINLYGHYPTFAHREILRRFPFVDSITVGEPEFTFLDLARNISGVTNSDISSIDGLVSRNTPPGGMAARRLHTDLDSLPFPDRRNIELVKRRGVAAYILGSRGCYNSCGFCYLNPFYGSDSGWRGRSAANIFAEMKWLYCEKGCRDFYFADANFFGPGRRGMERARELATLVINDGLRIGFGIECRANDVDKETIALLVSSGLKSLFIGIESGDQAVLDLFGKRTTVDTNRDAIQCVRGCGIEPNIGFIMFTPHSDTDGIRRNFEFLQEMALLRDPYTTAHLLCHKQSVFKGTPDHHDGAGDGSCMADSGVDNYELPCGFRDRRIEAFVDIVGSFCGEALAAIRHDSDAQGVDGCCGGVSFSTGGRYAELNSLLISLFDRLLTSIEGGIMDLSKTGIAALKGEHRILTRDVMAVSEQPPGLP